MSHSLEQEVANQKRRIQDDIGAFQMEMERSLAEHQNGIDRQLTDFLNKQNALVQNLSQQIDSFNRLCRTQGEDLAQINRKLNELTSSVEADKIRAKTEVVTLASGMSELKSSLAGVQEGLRSQLEVNAAVDASLQETATRFEQTLEKLKQLPLIGSKFK